MAKFDWRRVYERESFDARTGLDWRVGPSEGSKDPGLSSNMWSDYRDPPNMHWALEIAMRFGYERDAPGATEAVDSFARKMAARIYEHRNTNALLARTPQIYGRASRGKPFPSAYLAICFDFAAMRIALNPTARHTEKPNRVLRKFYSFPVMDARTLPFLKAFGEKAELTGIALALTEPGEPGRRLIFATIPPT